MSDITYDFDKMTAGETFVNRKIPAPRPKPGVKRKAKPKRPLALTPKQLDVLTRYANVLFRTGSTMARRPLAIAIGVTVTAAGAHIASLRKKGLLRRMKGREDAITPLGWNVLRRFEWRAPSPDKWCTFAVVVGLVARGEIQTEVPDPEAVPEIEPDMIDAP